MKLHSRNSWRLPWHRAKSTAGSAISPITATSSSPPPSPRRPACRRRSICAPHCPPVYDQGQLGSCTANAIAGAVQFVRMKAGEKPAFNPSRLFIYFNERKMEHTVGSDSGAQIRDGIKSVNKLGAPHPRAEDEPYDDTPADPAPTHCFLPNSSPAIEKPSPSRCSATPRSSPPSPTSG